MREQPGRFMDYPAELAARTLFELGRVEEGELLLADYASRREGVNEGGPVPYLSALRAIVEANARKQPASVG